MNIELPNHRASLEASRPVSAAAGNIGQASVRPARERIFQPSAKTPSRPCHFFRTYATTIVRVLALLILVGCSPASPYTNESPVALSQQIAATDRVVLIDSNAPGVRLEFSGAEAQRLVRAVAESRKIKMSNGGEPNCPGGMWTAFYAGTNLLAQVAGHDDHFRYSGGFYHDGSGALQTAWQTVYDQQDR